jgi:hypothetical protein
MCILGRMAPKLSDLSIDDLQASLEATEASVGRDSVSVRIMRRELQRKLQEQSRREKLARLQGQGGAE